MNNTLAASREVLMGVSTRTWRASSARPRSGSPATSAQVSSRRVATPGPAGRSGARRSSASAVGGRSRRPANRKDNAAGGLPPHAAPAAAPEGTGPGEEGVGGGEKGGG